ncbi:MAG: glycosyltransferase [Acidobacteriota bacterium]|nr:glycosyltransferase [Acidobacteriota bacterium]
MTASVRPRLLFLTERYPPDPGGVASSSGRIAAALEALGVDVDVVAWTRALQPGVVAQSGNVTRMGRFREWDNTLPHTLNLFDWMRTTRRYDAIWGHYLSPAGFLAVWYGRLKGIPATASIRGNDLDRDMFPPGDFARLLWTLQHAQCITAVTRDLAEKAASLSGRDDVLCVSNAVDHDVFAPLTPAADLRERLGVRPEEAVLGFAGELREKKGQQFLLEALRSVRQQRPACLLIIGEVRPSEIPRLLPLLGEGTLEDHRILVTGQLQTPAEVNLHLQLCDVYLQPSLWDGMPNALLEAMAAGCGCIGSDAGGIPEIIEHGANGTIVPRWELQGLGGAVLDWLNAGPAYRDRIRAAARAGMIANFSFDLERGQLQTVLSRLIPSSS